MSDKLPDTELDWEGLRKEIEANGSIRNVSLMATMPRMEPVTIMSGTSPGIHPVREPALYPIKGDDDLKNTPESGIISDLSVKFYYSKIEADLPACNEAMEKYVERKSDPSEQLLHKQPMTVESARIELDQIARKFWEQHGSTNMSVEEIQARVDARLKKLTPPPSPTVIQLTANKKEES